MPERSSPRFLIGVSLKMYFTHTSAVAWARSVAAICARHPAVRDGVVEIVVLPSYPALPAVVEAMAPHAVGAQDISQYDSGAYTGEVGGVELAELGCRFAEIGHAERRTLLGESSGIIAAKVAAAVRHGITPLLCVGETSRTSAFEAAAECILDIEAARASIDGRVDLVVAYEPHWAIGAPQPAPVEHIREVCGRIRAHFASSETTRVRVIYGGSAGPGLLERIAPDVDGMFLGRFAHDPAAVETILDEALSLARTP